MRNATICQAIENRQILSFIYDGTPREVEPHAHGEDAHGDSSLRAYLVSGISQGWRMFHTDKMFGLSALQETFLNPRPGYKRNDSNLRVIHCQL